MSKVKVTLASKLDTIVKTGGTWDEMAAKANAAAKRMHFTTKYNAGVLRAHVNYRIKTQKKATFLGDKVMSDTGIN